MTAPCPVCGMDGGFHDTDNKTGKHASHEVPRELLLEPGWAKEAHEELKRERAAQIAVLAAEIDDDKQQWFSILGLPTLVLGTRPTAPPVTIDEEGAGDLSPLPLPSPGGGA